MHQCNISKCHIKNKNSANNNYKIYMNKQIIDEIDIENCHYNGIFNSKIDRQIEYLNSYRGPGKTG